MSTSLQVLYPIVEGTNFDYDYYLNKHMPIVGEAIGEHIQSTLVTKGVAGGPDTPAGYYAIATIVFADQSASKGYPPAILRNPTQISRCFLPTPCM